MLSVTSISSWRLVAKNNSAFKVIAVYGLKHKKIREKPVGKSSAQDDRPSLNGDCQSTFLLGYYLNDVREQSKRKNCNFLRLNLHAFVNFKVRHKLKQKPWKTKAVVEKTMRQDGATNENRSALSSWKRNWQLKWLLSAGETYRATGYDIQFFTIWRLEHGFLDRKSLKKSVEVGDERSSFLIPRIFFPKNLIPWC